MAGRRERQSQRPAAGLAKQAVGIVSKQARVYPLSKATNPPSQALLDMTDILYNGLIQYDESFFTGLSRMLSEETVQPRDLEMMGMLLPLGIEKGKEFKPDAKTTALLKKAAEEAHAWLIDKATTDVTPWWPGSQWVVPTPPITIPTEFKWEMPNYFGVDARAIALSQYFCPTAKLGTGRFYFAAFHDSNGTPLEGGSTYRLHVPANVPVREFWSITVYSLKTSGFFLNSTRLTLSLLDKELRENSDGSVDIVGPKPPAGQTSNLIGFTPLLEKSGSRGFECMARKRQSWIRAGGCRTLRRFSSRHDRVKRDWSW